MDRELLTWLKAVKVTVEDGYLCRAVGHLTDLSCRMLVIELQRHGYEIVRSELELSGRTE